MDIIRKDATIQNTGDDKAFPGTFEVILSAPTQDRDGETLLPEEWKTPLPEHITFDVDHGMSVASTVGSGTPTVEEGTGLLKVAGTYSSLPRAQEVRTLVNEGHIRTTSVAFMTLREGKGPNVKISRELLNGAFVAVPSNREALILTSKGAKAGARNSSADKSLIQQILDAAIALGAELTVDESKAIARAGQKALAGSLEALQERARAALREANPGAYVWLRGTIPTGDGEGSLIFEVEDPDTYETELYRQAYTDSGLVVTLQGSAETVGVTEVVTPNPENAAEPPEDDEETPAAGAEESAPAAGVRSITSGDETAELETRSARYRALINLSNPEGTSE